MASAIKSVSYYKAQGHVETCSRCGQGIRYVACVQYKDGLAIKYGMDCIERILAGDTSLRSLFRKNVKLAGRYRDYLDILTGPVEKMPRGHEYFNSGLYFVADSEGKDIGFGHLFFHPMSDFEKNASGNRYVIKDVPAEIEKFKAEIDKGVLKIQVELARIEGFLARSLSKAEVSAK